LPYSRVAVSLCCHRKLAFLELQPVCISNNAPSAFWLWRAGTSIRVCDAATFRAASAVVLTEYYSHAARRNTRAISVRMQSRVPVAGPSPRRSIHFGAQNVVDVAFEFLEFGLHLRLRHNNYAQ
jgi:hypothetical protein